MSAKVTRRPATALEVRRALALARCKFAPFTFAKRFARELAPQMPLITEKQAAMLEQLCWTYRRQLGPDLAPPRNPKGET